MTHLNNGNNKPLCSSDESEYQVVKADSEPECHECCRIRENAENKLKKLRALDNERQKINKLLGDPLVSEKEVDFLKRRNRILESEFEDNYPKSAFEAAIMSEISLLNVQYA